MKRFLGRWCGVVAAVITGAGPAPGVAAPDQTWGLMAHPLAGSMTESEWLTHLATVSKALRDQAARTSDPLAEFEGRLRAANWTLAFEIEPMASRLVLGIPKPQDQSAALAHVASAREQLDQAAELWEALEAGERIESDQRWRLSDSFDALRAFAAGFAAIWHADEINPAELDALRSNAASNLALVLEDERRTVAAAGVLWQAFLYIESRDCERAMELLPPVLHPAEKLNTHDLFARLLRCQCTVELFDGRAAAIALLARLEEQSAQWDPAAGQGDSLRRTITYVRRSVLADWANVLDAANEPDRATWCRAATDIIDQDYFSEGEGRRLLRLGQAAPAVVDLDDAESVLEPEPAKAVATQPSASHPEVEAPSVPRAAPESATQPAEGTAVGE